MSISGDPMHLAECAGGCSTPAAQLDMHWNRRACRWWESSWQIKSALLIALESISFYCDGLLIVS